MSVINTNQFASGFTSTSVHQEFDNSPGAAPGESAPGFPQASDNIRFGGFGPVSQQAPAAAFDAGSFGAAEGAFGTGTGSYDFSSILNQIGSLISGLFQQLGSMFGSPSQTGSGSPPQGSTSGGRPEAYFTNASASSVGDPHLAFDGTTGAGATASDKWNSMTGHANLLSSDSFDGGYRVSTQTTAPNAKGIDYNDCATVTTDGGATAVSMQKDGAYSVTENGRSVSLTQGQSTSLGNGESVTLNSDGSLTVADANGSGTISTTLKSTGSAVDVTNTAHDVDLGGFLVHKTDNDVDPVANAAHSSTWLTIQNAPPAAAPAAQNAAFATPPFDQLPIATEPFQTQPMVTGLEQFDPDSSGTSLDSIDAA